jgi:hypothetical protein
MHLYFGDPPTRTVTLPLHKVKWSLYLGIGCSLTPLIIFLLVVILNGISWSAVNMPILLNLIIFSGCGWCGGMFIGLSNYLLRGKLHG